MEINFPKLEKRILNFWQDNGIFEKSIIRHKKAPNFVFYEGPPTANGQPGIHHVLSRILKDIICRYKTMKGFKVLRKAGWDTHGLPVELEIEKKLGLKSKKDIEKYGIAKFNKKCKESVWQYKKDWEKLTERIGFWLNMENPYITYQPEYIESVWWILKRIWQKGLLYKGYKVVPYCARCGTSLSSHEVALGYKRIKEPAIYIKFQILNPEFKNTSFLVWTTTPWTLPGNVAIALNPSFIYTKVKIGEEYLILAKERMEAVGLQGEIVKEFLGKDLIDLYYQPLYPVESQKGVIIYKTLPADFVSLKEGTGLVHIAPAFGEEDMELIKTQNSKAKSRASEARREMNAKHSATFKAQNPFQFPILLTVDDEGKFKLEVEKWAGMFAKEADPLIIEDLRKRNLLLKEELYGHDYPFCWRCDSHLLYCAKESWFINMQKVKKELIENNQKINWIPSHLKEGRFGEWLREIKDWAFSRERYWGTPLPIWQCKKCQNLEFIGSKEDLIKQRFSKNKYFILRHGDSLKNQKDIVSCWPEKYYFPLTKKGEEQIKEIAKKLKNGKVAETSSHLPPRLAKRDSVIDLIFSSDILRTKQTAEIIGRELGIAPKFDKKLREVNAGILNGKSIKEVGKFWDKEGKLPPLEYYSKRFQLTPPKGENYIDIEKRLLSFIKGIDKKFQGKNILIVGHCRPFTLLEKVIYGYDFKKFVNIIREKKEIKTGELKELNFKNLPYNKKMELDFHRPYVDEIKFYCKKCENLMERVPEVIDCWFDSGSMPFAQYHYPFENKNLIDQKIQFPADYISEAIDQTRGWFYTLLAISTLLDFETPYKNVISSGHVLDEKGEKMSKSKGNMVNPWEIVEKYGVDATRWYFYTVNQPGDSKLFSEKDVEGALKKFILTLWNCYLFWETYGEKLKSRVSRQRGEAGDECKAFSDPQSSKFKIKNILDRWIISRLNGLIRAVTENLDKYDVTGAARLIEKFIIDDFSLWYIRRSRKRFQRPETEKELKEASQILSFVLLTLSKLTAPFIPFLSDYIYQNLKSEISNLKSVHLEGWPMLNKKLIDKKLEKKMETVRGIVASALAERAKAKIKVRQPLSELRIKNYELRKEKELLDLIKEEVNVKEITFGKVLKLEKKITPQLKEEGMVREIIRNIQEMRKTASFKAKDKILVHFLGTAEINKVLEKNKELVLREANIKDLLLKKEKEIFAVKKEILVDQQKLWLGIKKN